MLYYWSKKSFLVWSKERLKEKSKLSLVLQGYKMIYSMLLQYMYHEAEDFFFSNQTKSTTTY